MKNLTEQPAWLALSQHHNEIASQPLRDAYRCEPDRFDRFSIRHHEILLDFSRNRINDKTIELLIQLAEDLNLKGKITDLLSGQPVNQTEARAALHTALRNQSQLPVFVNGTDVSEEIKAARQALYQFADDIHAGKRTGATGKPFQHIVNIGIGGSYLGPKMTTAALRDFAANTLRFHFISTIDPDHLSDVLAEIDPETTLFIVSSKSFSTLETLTNANIIRDWLEQKLGPHAFQKQFAAVTAKKDKALKYGIRQENIFLFWDWVGGRYSIWSAIGLPLLLMIGKQAFEEFLDGAHDIDRHFANAPFKANIPVMLGLLAIWYNNFFHASAQAIIPYSHRLRYFVDYIQQAEMESSGKSTRIDGEAVNYATGAVIFGEEGCNGQHSFHQLLHQGKHLIPVDFILIVKCHHLNEQQQQDLLLASALSQAHALVFGRSASEVERELQNTAQTALAPEIMSQHLAIEGNKPCNLLILERLNPRNLGALIAIYEHKIFVQCAIWNINPFDQWGVELGKQILPDILTHIQNNNALHPLDAATTNLIQHFNQLRDADETTN